MRANRIVYHSSSTGGLSRIRIPHLGASSWDSVNNHIYSIWAPPGLTIEISRIQIGSQIDPLNNPQSSYLTNETLKVAVFRSADESTSTTIFMEEVIGGSKADEPVIGNIHRNGSGSDPINGTLEDLHYDSYHVGRGWIWEPRPEERPRTSATFRTLGLRFRDIVYNEGLHGLPTQAPPVYSMVISIYFHEFD